MTETPDKGWLYQKIVEESQIAILYADREGRIRLSAATMQDVTERWQQQKELKSRLAALEAKAAESSRSH